MKPFKKTLLALTAGCLASGAMAQSASSNIAVSASVANACSISAAPLSFGSYDPLSGTALQASAALTIACTQGAVPVIAIGGGAQPNGTTTRRLLNGTTNYLNYSVFQPASVAASAACAYTTPWGDGTTFGATLTPVAAPSIAARNYNVCGQIPVGQNAPAGSYADTVAATINF